MYFFFFSSSHHKKTALHLSSDLCCNIPYLLHLSEADKLLFAGRVETQTAHILGAYITHSRCFLLITLPAAHQAELIPLFSRHQCFRQAFGTENHNQSPGVGIDSLTLAHAAISMQHQANSASATARVAQQLRIDIFCGSRCVEESL